MLVLGEKGDDRLEVDRVGLKAAELGQVGDEDRDHEVGEDQADLDEAPGDVAELLAQILGQAAMAQADDELADERQHGDRRPEGEAVEREHIEGPAQEHLRERRRAPSAEEHQHRQGEGHRPGARAARKVAGSTRRTRRTTSGRRAAQVTRDGCCGGSSGSGWRKAATSEATITGATKKTAPKRVVT
ncbi:MAG: hypothetical protein HGA45_33350 [Chloroflexales bacterium]|nr:hypothetical protein [Chloroflexales bacterium]